VRVYDLLSPVEQILDLNYQGFAAGKIFFQSQFHYHKLDMEDIPQEHQKLKNLPQTVNPLQDQAPSQKE